MPFPDECFMDSRVLAAIEAERAQLGRLAPKIPYHGPDADRFYPDGTVKPASPRFAMLNRRARKRSAAGFEERGW